MCKKLITAVFTVFLFFISITAVSALDEVGSITVNLEEGKKGTSVKNVELELIKIADEKDTEIRVQEKEIENEAYKKDTEKREFNWKLVGRISFALVAVVGISAGVLGNKIDFKLPKKY